MPHSIDLTPEILVGYVDVMRRPESVRERLWDEYADKLLHDIGAVVVTVTCNPELYQSPREESSIQVDTAVWARQAIKAERDFTSLSFVGATPQGTEYSFVTPRYNVDFARTHTGRLSQLALVGSEVRALVRGPDLGGTSRLSGVARLIAQDTRVSPPVTQIHSYLSVKR